MLEISREEIRKKIPDDVHGLKRVFRSIVLFVDQYIYEPVATTLRFFHLVIIFVPVIVTIPVMCFGGRCEDRDNERSGTLWWYGYLVASMERAGPTFIKVKSLVPLEEKESLLIIGSSVRTMGSI
jgi:aarF domain-containing kinase